MCVCVCSTGAQNGKASVLRNATLSVFRHVQCVSDGWMWMMDCLPCVSVAVSVCSRPGKYEIFVDRFWMLLYNAFKWASRKVPHSKRVKLCAASVICCPSLCKITNISQPVKTGGQWFALMQLTFSGSLLFVLKHSYQFFCVQIHVKCLNYHFSEGSSLNVWFWDGVSISLMQKSLGFHDHEFRSIHNALLT